MEEEKKQRNRPEPVTTDQGQSGYSEENLDAALAMLAEEADKLPATEEKKLADIAARKDKIVALLAKGMKRSRIIAQFKRNGYELPDNWLAKLIPSETRRSKALGKGIKEIAENRSGNKTIKKSNKK